MSIGGDTADGVIVIVGVGVQLTFPMVMVSMGMVHVHGPSSSRPSWFGLSSLCHFPPQ